MRVTSGDNAICLAGISSIGMIACSLFLAVTNRSGGSSSRHARHSDSTQISVAEMHSVLSKNRRDAGAEMWHARPRKIWRDDMLELLLPDDANETRDPLLQWRSQPNENDRSAFGVAPLLALALKQQELRPGHGQKPADEIGGAVFDRMNPPRGYPSSLDPFMPAILDEEQ